MVKLYIRPSTIAAVSLAILAVFAAQAVAEAPSRHLPKHVTPDIVKSISRGHKYLAAAQRGDGSWLTTGRRGSYPTVMTSLAGLGLMAGGSTPNSGPYAREVRKAMLYLIKVAESSNKGLVSQSGSRTMYGHGFSTLFLASCYGTELNKDQEERLKKVLDRAVKVIQSAQSRKSGRSPGGGWYYGPDNTTQDEGSVTVTQLQALRACRNVGIEVPVSMIDRAVAYLKFCQQNDGGICYSATSRGSSRPAISAAAIACFYSAGIFDRRAGGQEGPEARMVDKLLAYVKKKVSPTPGGGYSGYYFYTQMYMSQVMYIQSGKEWQNYYTNIAKYLLETQGPDGSWNGDGIGTTYGTAIATLILQLPYGYVPFCQK
jgi:squalene cyclase